METIKDIDDALDALASAMGDKGLPTPTPRLTRCHGGRSYIWLDWGSSRKVNGETYKSFHADTPTLSIAAAMDWIYNLPSPEQEAIRTFHAKVGAAIEFGRDNGIDDEYVTPLVETRKAMTENLLTSEASS